MLAQAMLPFKNIDMLETISKGRVIKKQGMRKTKTKITDETLDSLKKQLKIKFHFWPVASFLDAMTAR